MIFGVCFEVLLSAGKHWIVVLSGANWPPADIFRYKIKRRKWGFEILLCCRSQTQTKHKYKNTRQFSRWSSIINDKAKENTVLTLCLF